MKLYNCIVGRYATIGDNSITDGDIDVKCYIVGNSIIWAKEKVALLRYHYRILSTGKFVELGFDSKNFYFAENNLN